MSLSLDRAMRAAQKVANKAVASAGQDYTQPPRKEQTYHEAIKAANAGHALHRKATKSPNAIFKALFLKVQATLITGYLLISQMAAELAIDFPIFHTLDTILNKGSVQTASVAVLGFVVTCFLMLAKWLQQLIATGIFLYIIYTVAMTL